MKKFSLYVRLPLFLWWWHRAIRSAHLHEFPEALDYVDRLGRYGNPFVEATLLRAFCLSCTGADEAAVHEFSKVLESLGGRTDEDASYMAAYAYQQLSLIEPSGGYGELRDDMLNRVTFTGVSKNVTTWFPLTRLDDAV